MKIFISAPREKATFVTCVDEVAQERHSSTVFCPNQFRNLDDEELLRKVTRELEYSHLVFMDVSMEKVGDKWYPDSGVMIEFGLIIKDPTKGLGFLYLFCDESTDRDQLPPMIPRIEVTKYDSSKPEELKGIIRQAIEKFLEEEAPERLRQERQRSNAAITMTNMRKSRYTD